MPLRPSLIAEMWGMTDLDNPVKHHVQLALNGQAVADSYFVGSDVEIVSEQVPAGSVQEGVNTVKFTVPNDLGGEYDMRGPGDVRPDLPARFCGPGWAARLQRRG